MDIWPDLRGKRRSTWNDTTAEDRTNATLLELLEKWLQRAKEEWAADCAAVADFIPALAKQRHIFSLGGRTETALPLGL